MYWYPPHKLAFSSQDQQVLEQAEISYEHGPGTIVRDFDTLLAYIKERDLQVTAAGQLRLRPLAEINARLTHPIEHGLQRPVQKSFPQIHGLYLLVRASGLTCINMVGKKPILVVDEQVDQAWQRLNPTERYGNLLETWFLRGRPEIIRERGPRSYRVPENFRESVFFVAGIPDEGLQVAGNRDVEDWLTYSPGSHNLGLLDLFGLIDVRRGTPEPSRGWRIERIARTRFGTALFGLLQARFFGDLNNIFGLEAEREIPFGVLQPILQPYFPAWENNLILPRWTSREGAHVFKVSLGRVWRRIAIPAGDDLDTLAAAILDSVGFDQDHLYEFQYRSRFGTLEHVHHPYMDEGPWTSEASAGEVPLGIGQTMTFVYDFGDWWEFAVTLERVDPSMDIDRPATLESQGEPPQQYPSWDENER